MKKLQVLIPIILGLGIWCFIHFRIIHVFAAVRDVGVTIQIWFGQFDITFLENPSKRSGADIATQSYLEAGGGVPPTLETTIFGFNCLPSIENQSATSTLISIPLWIFIAAALVAGVAWRITKDRTIRGTQRAGGA